MLRDFWEQDLAEVDKNVKETWEITEVLESLPSDIQYSHLDVQVNNQAVINTWMRSGGDQECWLK